MAARFFVDGSVNRDFGFTGNWSATSGGATGSTVPSNADDVTFDGASPDSCNINASARACLSLTTTLWNGTLNFAQPLSVGNAANTAGNITLSSTTLFTGSASLATNATNTITSNGCVIGVPLVLAAAGATRTHTLADDMFCSRGVDFGRTGALVRVVFNGANLYVSERLQVNNTTTGVDGTTNIIMTGTGFWAHTNTLRLENNLTFSGTTITVSGQTYYATGTITHRQGTMVTTGSQLNVTSNIVLETSGMTWNIIKNTGAGNMTLNSRLNSSVLDLGSVDKTFLGTGGFNVGNLSGVGAGNITHTFTTGNTYNVTNSFLSLNTNSNPEFNRNIFVSATPGSQVTLNFSGSTAPQAFYLSATDMDSSSGSRVYNYNGTISNTSNWKVVTTLKPATVASTF